jgi:hypothetical protein
MSEHRAAWRNKNKRHWRQIQRDREDEAGKPTIDLAAEIQKLADRTDERRALRKARSFGSLVAALKAKQCDPALRGRRRIWTTDARNIVWRAIYALGARNVERWPSRLLLLGAPVSQFLSARRIISSREQRYDADPAGQLGGTPSGGF